MLYQLLKSVKKWVFEAADRQADNELKLYKDWFEKDDYESN